MNNEKRTSIERLTAIRTTYAKVKNAISSIKENPFHIIFAILTLMIEVTFAYSVLTAPLLPYKMVGAMNFTNPFLCTAVKVCVIPIVILIDVIILRIIGTPAEAYFHSRDLRRIGIYNSAQEVPILLSVQNDGNIRIFEYDNVGVPLKMFIDNKESIEASLNVSISDIYLGQKRNRIIIKAFKGEVMLPDFVRWSDDYLSEKSSEIVLGVALNEKGSKTVDLDITPHVQCGGNIGSGKTKLLEVAIYQMMKKGAEIILCDFKNFVDFPFHDLFLCVDSKEALNNMLEKIIAEMERRKEVFVKFGCTKISEYNEKYPMAQLRRIFFACDEIAFAFQRKGLTGEEKKLVESIEKNMTVIAQQGRFAGIHLWLSTQRGDADTIPPQIRSNLSVRVCGRASEILSRVTVDNSLASEIPKHLVGRFVYDDGECFQGFYFNFTDFPRKE